MAQINNPTQDDDAGFKKLMLGLNAYGAVSNIQKNNAEIDAMAAKSAPAAPAAEMPKESMNTSSPGSAAAMQRRMMRS